MLVFGLVSGSFRLGIGAGSVANANRPIQQGYESVIAV
jgi:hypothetical protein